MSWLREKAEEANEAMGSPNTSQIFRVVKELTKGASRKARDGGFSIAANQQEAEAWKEYFRLIQEGEGEVEPGVWADVAGKDVDDRLDDAPSVEEVRRAINDMKNGKTGGEDQMIAEYLKLGGPIMFEATLKIVDQCWLAATRAPEGGEHTAWPSSWNTGVIIPLWKKKGDRRNKNTWRGITLLSVGSKLVARICAMRLQRWCRSWLNPLQFGFRAGSGVDDTQQVSRRLLEEGAQSAHNRTFSLRFFDLEKAYPKVARHALWRALTIKGCPGKFQKVLRAIHEGTASKVRVRGFESTSFIPGRGLREGCPSSPSLFNLMHHCIMEVYRARRARQARAAGLVPGVEWTYKVDGRVAKRKGDREDEGRHTRRRIIGDFAYADDTGIIGDVAETRTAEALFAGTISDFAGKVNVDKTEGLRVQSMARPATDVPWLGELHTVKHVGALLSERAGHVAETGRASRRCISKIEELSGAWTRGKQIRRRRHDLKRSVRIKVLKAVVKGILFSFCRTRAWQTSQISRMQNIINFAVRRAFNVKLRTLRRNGLTNRIMTGMAQWEPFDQAVRRATLLWVGHVARMTTEQPQKQVLFGWIEGTKAKQRCPFKQAQWINSCLRRANIAEMDWFRLAQNRSAWKRKVLEAFPPEVVKVERERVLDGWRIGDPIPDWALPGPQEQREEPHEDSDEELGEVRRGNNRDADPRPYGRRPRARRQDRREDKGVGVPTCPVCALTFNKTNQLAFHYEAEHSICDPNITTVQSFRCPFCFHTYRRAGQLKSHVCPAQQRLVRLDHIDSLERVGGPDRGTALPLPTAWHIFTDGSGGTAAAGADAVARAGWGVVVYPVANPNPDLPWIAALYGPVNIDAYDPVWLGARRHTNNTAELSAT